VRSVGLAACGGKDPSRRRRRTGAGAPRPRSDGRGDRTHGANPHCQGACGL